MRESRTSRRLSAVPLRALTLALIAALTVPLPAHASRSDSDTICGVPLSSGEITRTVAPDARMRAGILLSADGRALWARIPDSPLPMASITKVMTALLALDDAGLTGSGLDDVVTVSKAAASVEDATGLVAGERISVRTLLELALVTSSNDAAYALGEHSGGTMSAFVARMNAKAKLLGLTHTHYANPHGLDAPGHHSSAADIASLARTAMKSDEFRRIVALRSATLPAYKTRTQRTIKSTDELLGTYRGILGVKTGFTNDAKHCFVGSAERGGTVLTAVVLGASNNKARFTQCATLLDWGFSHFQPKEIANSSTTVGGIPLSANRAVKVPVRFAETTSVPVFDLGGEVTSRLDLVDEIDAPVFEGQPVGEVVILQDTRVLTRVAAVAARATASAEETVGFVPVSDYLDLAVAARADGSGRAVRRYDPNAPVNRTVNLDVHVEAPVSEGQRIGEITYSQGGKEIVRVPVVAAMAVADPGVVAKIGTWFTRGWRLLTRQPTMAARVVLHG